jgi:hypothetical protein
VTVDLQAIFSYVALPLLVVLGLWATWAKEKKTYDKKKREAAKNGWTYRRFDRKLHRKYRYLPFVDGGSLRATHVMRGESRGRPLTMFTLQFSTEEYVDRGRSGDDDLDNDGNRDTHRVKHRYGVVAVGLPAPLPDFDLQAKKASAKPSRPQRLLRNVIGAVGGMVNDSVHTATVETGDEVFDKAFEIWSSNPERIRELLTPTVRTWLLKSDKAKKYTVRCTGDEIVTWGTGTDTAIGKVKANYLNDLLDQLPADQLWGPPPA